MVTSDTWYRLAGSCRAGVVASATSVAPFAVDTGPPRRVLWTPGENPAIGSRGEPGCRAHRLHGAPPAAHRLLELIQLSAVRTGRSVSRPVPGLRAVARVPRQSWRPCPGGIRFSRPITGASGRAWRLRNACVAARRRYARASPGAMPAVASSSAGIVEFTSWKRTGRRGRRTAFFVRRPVQSCAFFVSAQKRLCLEKHAKTQTGGSW
jgi:hypothetical protein